MMKFKINRHHIRIMMSLFLLLAIFLFSTYSVRLKTLNLQYMMICMVNKV